MQCARLGSSPEVWDQGGPQVSDRSECVVCWGGYGVRISYFFLHALASTALRGTAHRCTLLVALATHMLLQLKCSCCELSHSESLQHRWAALSLLDADSWAPRHGLLRAHDPTMIDPTLTQQSGWTDPTQSRLLIMFLDILFLLFSFCCAHTPLSLSLYIFFF